MIIVLYPKREFKVITILEWRRSLSLSLYRSARELRAIKITSIASVAETSCYKTAITRICMWKRKGALNVQMGLYISHIEFQFQFHLKGIGEYELHCIRYESALNLAVEISLEFESLPRPVASFNFFLSLLLGSRVIFLGENERKPKTGKATLGKSSICTSIKASSRTVGQKRPSCELNSLVAHFRFRHSSHLPLSLSPSAPASLLPH